MTYLSRKVGNQGKKFGSYSIISYLFPIFAPTQVFPKGLDLFLTGRIQNSKSSHVFRIYMQSITNLLNLGAIGIKT